MFLYELQISLTGLINSKTQIHEQGIIQLHVKTDQSDLLDARGMPALATATPFGLW